MSPNEAQLRAALREGGGGRVDADVIIANAERQRRARRQRISYAAAAVVVAAVVGVGGTLLATLGSGDDTAGGSSAHNALGVSRAVPSPADSGSAAAGGAYQGNAELTPVASCPATRGAVPGRAGSTRAGRLLPAHVSAITACAYPAGARVRSATFGGQQAARIAAAVNGGARTPGHGPPCRPPKAIGRMTLFPADAHGRRAAAVTLTVGCPRSVASNGTVTRYPATLPAALTRLVR